MGVTGQKVDLSDRILSAAVRTEPVGARLEIRLEDRFEHRLEARLNHPVGHGGDGGFILPLLQLGFGVVGLDELSW